jgi:hypothetical protein
MYLARYQWNFLGRDIGFASGDLENRESPAASFAISGLTNRSRYTRFSSSGGGQLDGFEAGAPGQYSLKQANAEFTFKYRGFSVQNENHWKNVYGHVNLASTDMRGAYAQAGYFLHNLLPDIPKIVEVGYRYAYVDPDTRATGDLRQEHTAVVNIFVEGHDNKLSFDAGRVYKSRTGLPDLSSWRYRVQWDVHF